MGILTNSATDTSVKEKFSPRSRFIELIEYDPIGMTLDITFKTGSKSRYVRVFPSTFLSFKQSPTHDAFYTRAIKGNLLSVKIIDTNIGTQKSTPLKKVTKEQDLDRGLKRQQARDKQQYERSIAGTVKRALNAA